MWSWVSGSRPPAAAASASPAPAAAAARQQPSGLNDPILFSAVSPSAGEEEGGRGEEKEEREVEAVGEGEGGEKAADGGDEGTGAKWVAESEGQKGEGEEGREEDVAPEGSSAEGVDAEEAVRDAKMASLSSYGEGGAGEVREGAGREVEVESRNAKEGKEEEEEEDDIETGGSNDFVDADEGLTDHASDSCVLDMEADAGREEVGGEGGQTVVFVADEEGEREEKQWQGSDEGMGEATPLLQGSLCAEQPAPAAAVAVAAETEAGATDSATVGQTWWQSVGWDEEIAGYSFDGTRRIRSLDVVRGKALIGMAACVGLGPLLPSLYLPTPWLGFTPADLFLPLLLFVVGVSTALSYQTVPCRTAAANRIYTRFAKIFYLGLLLQSGFFHGASSFAFGVDVGLMRYCGTLQIVAGSFLLVGFCEVLVMKLFRQQQQPQQTWKRAGAVIVHWGAAIGLAALYIYLSYFINVPSWSFSIPPSSTSSLLSSSSSPLTHPTSHAFLSSTSTSSSSSHLLLPSDSIPQHDFVSTLAATSSDTTGHAILPHSSAATATATAAASSLASHSRQLLSSPLSPHMGGNDTTFQVSCNVSGSLSPACCSAAYIDRLLLGISHLPQQPAFRRLPNCSTASPAVGPLPPDAPSWCLAPFEPLGTLSQLGAALVSFAGLRFGHVLSQFKGNGSRFFRGLFFSLLLFLASWLLQLDYLAISPPPVADLLASLHLPFLGGMPMVPSLFTLPFVLFASAAACLFLTIFYLLVDILPLGLIVAPFEWVGRNPLFFFVVAVTGLGEAFIAAFHLHTPSANLVTLLKAQLAQIILDPFNCNIAFELSKLFFWVIISGVFGWIGIIFYF